MNKSYNRQSSRCLSVDKYQRLTDQWGNYPADYVDNEKMLNHVMINDMVMFQSMSITVVIISSINKILIVISSHLVALLRDIAKYHMLN